MTSRWLSASAWLLNLLSFPSRKSASFSPPHLNGHFQQQQAEKQKTEEKAEGSPGWPG